MKITSKHVFEACPTPEQSAKKYKALKSTILTIFVLLLKQHPTSENPVLDKSQRA